MKKTKSEKIYEKINNITHTKLTMLKWLDRFLSPVFWIQEVGPGIPDFAILFAILAVISAIISLIPGGGRTSIFFCGFSEGGLCLLLVVSYCLPPGSYAVPVSGSEWEEALFFLYKSPELVDFASRKLERYEPISSYEFYLLREYAEKKEEERLALKGFFEEIKDGEIDEIHSNARKIKNDRQKNTAGAEVKNCPIDSAISKSFIDEHSDPFLTLPLYHLLGTEKIEEVQISGERSWTMGDILVSLKRIVVSPTSEFFSLMFNDLNTEKNVLALTKIRSLSLPYGAMTLQEISNKVREYIEFGGAKDGLAGSAREKFFRKFLLTGEKPVPFGPPVPFLRTVKIFKSEENDDGTIDSRGETLGLKVKGSVENLVVVKPFFQSSQQTVLFCVFPPKKTRPLEILLPIDYTRSLTRKEMVTRLETGLPLVQKTEWSVYAPDFFWSLSLLEMTTGTFAPNSVGTFLAKFFEVWKETTPSFFIRTTGESVQLLAQDSQGFSPIHVVAEKTKGETRQNATEKFLGQMILSGKLPEKAWESPLPTPPTHSYREGL